MGRSRLIVAAAGTVLAVVGAGIVLDPALAGLVSVPNIPVSVVGALSLIVAFVVALRRRDTTIRAADPEEVEDIVEHPRPGDDFDDALRGSAGIGIEAARNRRQAREHLADVTIQVLVMVEGYSEADADEALAAGTWTDDPVAAACFASEPPSQGFGDVVSQYVDRRPQYERELHSVITELQARIDGAGER